MNLPNKLTMLRVLMIPFFVFFMLFTETDPGFKWFALALFCLASLTDMFDGMIARKYNLITDFGKFMDPLADKLLVTSAMICLTALGKLPAWVTVIVVAREFAISGFRLIAADNGIVIAASMWGKSKTVSQMAMVILLIADLTYPWYVVLSNVVMWIAVILTVVSLVDYIAKNRSVLDMSNI
ncbi:MAG: CDP-diacylglycerol--glycerol-3-phosphate 3-phosphatidyltransferase [Lachnospiraceae bacterium]|nr:CDP-diacylglycerol--glycerol-3-phosphate 3-phosphatidyltransferase [Lachnospiraceae bacterium]